MSLYNILTLKIVLTSLRRGGGDPGFHLFEGPFFLQDIPCSRFAPIDVLITSVAVCGERPNELFERDFDGTLKGMFSDILEEGGRDCILVRLSGHTEPSHDGVGDGKAFCITTSTNDSRNKVRADLGNGPARSVIVKLLDTSVPV